MVPLHPKRPSHEGQWAAVTLCSVYFYKVEVSKLVTFTKHPLTSMASAALLLIMRYLNKSFLLPVPDSFMFTYRNDPKYNSNNADLFIRGKNCVSHTMLPSFNSIFCNHVYGSDVMIIVSSTSSISMVGSTITLHYREERIITGGVQSGQMTSCDLHLSYGREWIKYYGGNSN